MQDYTNIKRDMEFEIIKENNPALTFRVQSVIGKFDLQGEKFTQVFKGNIELDDNWQIGLIVGNSGTGKTTIAKQLFPDSYITDFKYSDSAIIDEIGKSESVDDIVRMFNSVGFSSPTSWLKPYSVLSNGEKMRVDLANALLNENKLIVFDEFTSVVDRNIAKIGSYAVQKSIRKSDKKFIAVGCHFDIEEWIQPDWVFNTNTMDFYVPQKKNLKSNMNYGKQWINQYGSCLVNTTI